MLPASSGVKCEVRHFKPKGGGWGGGSVLLKHWHPPVRMHCHNPKDYNLSHHYENLASFIKSEEAGLKL
jgi:hypothetical protein